MWSASIPEVFCGTPEGCIAWSYTLKYAAVFLSRGRASRLWDRLFPTAIDDQLE